jgi:hypothetical protein
MRRFPNIAKIALAIGAVLGLLVVASVVTNPGGAQSKLRAQVSTTAREKSAMQAHRFGQVSPATPMQRRGLWPSMMRHFGAHVVASGFGDKHHWDLIGEPDGDSTCVFLVEQTTKEMSEGGCFHIYDRPPDTPYGARYAGYIVARAPWHGSSMFIFGPTALQVAAVRTRHESGGETSIATFREPHLARGFFVEEWSPNSAGTLVAVDVDGRPLETQSFPAGPDLGPARSCRTTEKACAPST